MQTIFDEKAFLIISRPRYCPPQPRFQRKSAKIALPLSTGPIKQGPNPDRREQTQCFTSKEFQLSSVMIGKNKNRQWKTGRKKAQKCRKVSHKPRSEANEFSLLDSFAHQTSGGFVYLLWPKCTMRPVLQKRRVLITHHFSICTGDVEKD